MKESIKETHYKVENLIPRVFFGGEWRKGGGSLRFSYINYVCSEVYTKNIQNLNILQGVYRKSMIIIKSL